MCFSPLLYLLYINAWFVTWLHERKSGVQCGDDTVPSLLFAGDTSLLLLTKEGWYAAICSTNWSKQTGWKPPCSVIQLMSPSHSIGLLSISLQQMLSLSIGMA